jgi:hypothetical protein
VGFEPILNIEFTEKLPSILGGFLDTIVKALNLKEHKKPPKLYRLADFSEWGYVLAEALGYEPEDFNKAMDENLDNQNTADIENNVIADAFLSYLTEDLTFASATEETPKILTPDEAFRAVTSKAETKGITIKNRKWPSAPHSFTRKLNESKASIIAHGWNYEIIHSGKKREMHIWHIGTFEPTKTQDKKTKYAYKQIPSAEPCRQCENFVVQYEIEQEEGKKERLCETCFQRRQRSLPDAHWEYKKEENT